MIYELRSGKEGEGYTPYGSARDFMYCHDAEVIIEGPAETGKTLAAMWKLDICALKYPGSSMAIVRKVQSAIYGTCLETFQKQVLSKGSPAQAYGGNKPEWYDYPNGSRIYLGGMDKPGKVLSGERDIIYVNQAEELMPADWEILTTRTTGRAGNMPYNQCIGDCNPAHANHWILDRAKTGKLTLFHSTHKDNPTLWDPVNQRWTEQGEDTLSQLGGLTGALRARLFEGKWAAAEGVIYEEFRRAIHVMKREGPWTEIIIGADEGYTNPAVLLVIGVDNDGRKHVLQEFYKRRQLQADVVGAAKEMAKPYQGAVLEVDPSAAGLIAEMQGEGLYAYPANNSVFEGIQSVKAELAVAGDGRPRLTFDPSCVNTIAELESYCWKEHSTGLRDEPEKVNDHAMDALRYAVMGTRAIEGPPEGIYVYDDRVEISPY